MSTATRCRKGASWEHQSDVISCIFHFNTGRCLESRLLASVRLWRVRVVSRQKSAVVMQRSVRDSHYLILCNAFPSGLSLLRPRLLWGDSTICSSSQLNTKRLMGQTFPLTSPRPARAACGRCQWFKFYSGFTSSSSSMSRTAADEGWTQISCRLCTKEFNCCHSCTRASERTRLSGGFREVGYT